MDRIHELERKKIELGGLPVAEARELARLRRDEERKKNINIGIDRLKDALLKYPYITAFTRNWIIEKAKEVME